jgi:hypothetical protein
MESGRHGIAASLPDLAGRLALSRAHVAMPAALFLVAIGARWLFTWVYDGMRGSLPLATPMHASLITTGVFLPVGAGPGGELMLPLTAIGLEFVTPLAVVLVTGLGRLSRLPRVIR